jgi:hypothetical protein
MLRTTVLLLALALAGGAPQLANLARLASTLWAADQVDAGNHFDPNGLDAGNGFDPDGLKAGNGFDPNG